MRIAIIGAGVSGLTAAYLLQRSHEVTVFEAGSYAGGHAHTVTLESADGTQNLDTGFIVFNDRNYPNFERLLERIGVRSQASDMSFGVSDESGSFEYASSSLNALFARRRSLISPSFQHMLTEIPRFQRAARRLLASGDEQLSLSDWLDQQGFSRGFVEHLIVPQVSAVWSSDPAQMSQFPAVFLARFLDNHGMLSLRGRPDWRTVVGGSASYVEALTRGFRERLRLRAQVRRVARRDDGGVDVTVGGTDTERFDRVVIATHSDQALAMLEDASDTERDVLGAIAYQENEAVLHTDQTLLPQRRRAWASWNYHLLDEPSDRTTVTYHLNRLQSIRDQREFCVTLNLTERIEPSKILRRITYAHPVYTSQTLAAQRRFDEISGVGQTHFCGAYWGSGFHEDGVVSGLRVAGSFGESL